jgi:hypothetical protein
MTTREEYAEAAKWIQTWQVDCAENGMVPTPYILAIRVLRALADGAVLCSRIEHTSGIAQGLPRIAYEYIPLDPQP